jgi:hypothetical protein
MRTCLILLTVIVFVPAVLSAQEKEDEQSVKIKGYVKADVFYDSRQTVAPREGHLLLWPAEELKDANGDDINAQPNFNQLAVQTRVTGMFKGPEAFGAKSSALIEGAFFGISNDDVNQFRMRHAFVKLDWEDISLLAGQYWHPLFVTACFPGVVSFNTGMPFQPFSRNPQLRLTKYFGKTQIAASLVSQRDFTSPGGSITLRNAVIPNLNLFFQHPVGDHLVGGSVDYKRLKPEMMTNTGLKADETVSGTSLLGFAKLQLNNETSLKLEGVMGQNLYDLLMVSGYAVESVKPVTGERTFTPMKLVSVWADFASGKDIQYGLFVGYTKNQGTVEDNIGIYYSGRQEIDNVMRVAPRVIWNSGPTRLAGELEYTSAAFGSNKEDGTVTDTKTVSNLRLLFGAYYFFNN